MESRVGSSFEGRERFGSVYCSRKPYFVKELEALGFQVNLVSGEQAA